MHHERSGEVTDIRENERQILSLTTGCEVSRALAADPRIYRRLAPPLYEFGSVAVLRQVSPLDEDLRNPGAAHLVFLAKFAPAARTNYRDMTKILPLKMARDRRVIAQTSQEYRIGTP